MTAGLVFDFDGTILDTEHSVFGSWADLWERHGQTLDRQVWQSEIGRHNRLDPWGDLEARIGRSLTEADADWRRRRRDELLLREKPRDGVLEWLDAAHELGLPVGVASSSSQEWVEGNLERLNLRDHITYLVCRTETVPPKPDPTSFRLVCEHLGIDPAVSVGVEDSPPGVTAAKAVGLFTVAVPHPLTADLDLSAADVTVDSLHDLTLADALRRSAHRNPT